MARDSVSQAYEMDEDGYPREIVGPWVKDKHTRLARYVGISRAVRAKFIGRGKAGATFIDLYSGPGRVRIRGEKQAIDGSPLVAWHGAVDRGAPYTQVHVADADPKLSAAVEARLKNADAPVFAETGPAVETVDRVIRSLNPHALHFAFLDPYNLGDLPFEIIRKLATLKRMDILIHVSIHDLQRNLDRYIEKKNSALDSFAPGWRDKVDVERTPKMVRAKIWEHWRSLLTAESMATTETAELIVGTRKQRLYWLAFAARHERALEFWEKIRNIGGDRQPAML
ncbi:MAG: three-Cys-motif partner protein TcmP [Rhodospirillales bacterium]